MQELLRNTTAYKLLASEAKEGRLANTYLLIFNDEDNLRLALTEFARLFFDDWEETYRRIANGNHPDCLFYPEAGKVLDKDGAKAVIEESCLSPVESKRKLFVLDNFHRANATVQNKLLKSLEEPFDGVHFLLGATSEFPLLSTVKSRAKKLEIPPFSTKEVGACLKRIYPERDDIALYAQAAEGSVGRAQRLMEGGKFAVIQEKAYLCVSANNATIPAAARALNNISEKNEVISQIRRMYRDMLFYLTKQPYAIQDGISEKLKTLAKEFTPAVLVFALDVFAEADKQLNFNANLSQCVEVALWKIDKEKRKCKK